MASGGGIVVTGTVVRKLPYTTTTAGCKGRRRRHPRRRSNNGVLYVHATAAVFIVESRCACISTPPRWRHRRSTTPSSVGAAILRPPPWKLARVRRRFKRLAVEARRRLRHHVLSVRTFYIFFVCVSRARKRFRQPR